MKMKSLSQHLVISYGLGLGLRLLAACSGWGWFSPDDYQFGIEQPAHWLKNFSRPFACDFRSPLLSYGMWLLMMPAQYFFGHAPDVLLRCAYVGLALLGSLLVPLGYGLAAPWGYDTQVASMYLLASFALLPRISTRAMYETAAMLPLTAGVVALTYLRACRLVLSWRQQLLGGLVVGLAFGVASLLRFHAWILFVPVLLLLGWDGYRQRYAGLPYAASVGALLSMLLCLGLQAGLDSSLQRPMLSTLWRYVTFNLQFAHTYGVSPWYTYGGHFLLYTLPPLSFWLLPRLWQAMREHVTLTLVFGFFVVMHSCIGHKEDRFVYPVLPLFVVLLARALVLLRANSTPIKRWVERSYWLINSVAVVLLALSDGHRNITTPLLYLSRLANHSMGNWVAAASVGIGEPPHFYATPAAVRDFADITSLQNYLQTHPAVFFSHILLSHPADVSGNPALAKLPRHRCQVAQIYHGDFVDQVLVAINHRNAGRAPTTMLFCYPAAESG